MEKKIFFGLLFLLNLSFIFGQPPTEIPKDIILAGAVDEFIDVSCAMAKYHTTQYIDGMNSVISHFENIKSEYPDYVSSETDELNTMTTELQSKLDALCSANADTYSSAISDITALSTGSNGLEKRGRVVGENMESQLKVKGEEQKTKGLGMKDIGNQLKEKGNQITSLQAQIQSAQGQNAQTIGMQIQTVQGEMTQLQAQLGDYGSNMEGLSNEEITAKALEFENKGLEIEEKMNKVFGDIEAKIQSAFEEKDYSSLKADANEKMYQLFLKVFEYNTKSIGDIRAEFSFYGLDTAVVDELMQWIDDKKKEAKTIFTADAEESEINEWTAKLRTDGDAFNEKISGMMEEEVSEKWLAEFEKLKSNADAGIETAKSAGMDTSKVEELMARLEAMEAEAMVLKETNKSVALLKIREAEPVVKELKVEYAKLQANGEEVKGDIAKFTAELETQRETINALISSADNAELDASILQSMVDEMNSYGEKAKAEVEAGNITLAIEYTNKVRDIYAKVREEYKRLAGEMQ